MAKSKSAKVKIECSECGGGLRNHDIIAEHNESGTDDETGFFWRNTYQICKCCGCDVVRFRDESFFSENYDYATGQLVPSVSVYPEAKPTSRTALDLRALPDRVDRIYRETVKAFNAGALTLAGGGLRAIVEAVCIEQNVKGNNLEVRIDGLATKGLLANAQAELLHEERYIGNSALHEIELPAQQDIEDGLQIVESLLNTIYVAPTKAARLKKQRLKKSEAKSKSTAADPT